jgi:hypothetical protein
LFVLIGTIFGSLVVVFVVYVGIKYPFEFAVISLVLLGFSGGFGCARWMKIVSRQYKEVIDELDEMEKGKDG